MLEDIRVIQFVIFLVSNEDLLTLQFDPDCGDIFLAQYEQTDIPSSAMTSKTKTLFWSGARRE